MLLEHPLIGRVTVHDEKLVVGCARCDWQSEPVSTGTECGLLWDDHVATVHTA